MENNLILTLDALALSGCIVPSEQQCAIKFSIKIKKRDAGLRDLSLWGRIFTSGGKDYLLAEGVKTIKMVKRKLVFDTRYYFSQNGALWLDLQAPTEEQFELCKKIKGPFRGDPSHVYFIPDPPEPPKPVLPPPIPTPGEQPRVQVPTDQTADALDEKVEGEEETSDVSEVDEDDLPNPVIDAVVELDEEGPDPELNPEEAEEPQPIPPKGKEVGELVRLASLMRWIDEDCGVVPIGGMVLDARDNLVKNYVFPGLEFPEKLDSYGHLFRGYEKAPLSNDTTGFWSIQQENLSYDIFIRSLLWPGYNMYYSGTTFDYGSLYFGWGEINKDIAFMIN